MAFYDDRKSVIQDWPKSTKKEKCWMVLSTLIAVASVATLVDSLIVWKGLFIEGLQVYELYITRPVKLVFMMVNINISNSDINILIICSLILKGGLKIQNDHMSDFFRKVMLSAIFLCIIGLIGDIFVIDDIRAYYDLDSNTWSLSTRFIMIVVFLPTFYVSVFLNSMWISQKPLHKDFLLFWTPIVTSLLLICLFGVINKVYYA